MDHDAFDISANDVNFDDKNLYEERKELCDNCLKLYSMPMLDNSGETYLLKFICLNCIREGKIWKCCGCNCFMELDELFSNDLARDTGSAYCLNCDPPITLSSCVSRDTSSECPPRTEPFSRRLRENSIRIFAAPRDSSEMQVMSEALIPSITFTFNIRPYSTNSMLVLPPKIMVTIPPEKNLSLPWDYFYRSISCHLGISEDKIIICGQTLSSVGRGSKRKFMCPLDYKTDERVFDASIMD